MIVGLAIQFLRRGYREGSFGDLLHHLFDKHVIFLLATLTIYGFIVETIHFVPATFLFLVATMYLLEPQEAAAQGHRVGGHAGRAVPDLLDAVPGRPALTRPEETAMYTGLEGFLQPFMSVSLIGWIGIGTLVGLYVGAIPGLSVTMAVSLLISFTFSWDVLPALAIMVGIYTGGVYGGARSGILLNIPGAPAAVASGFDGYPLAKMGLAGQAMGLSTTEAVIGNFFGIVVLALFAPLIAQLALVFQPRDYFLLAFMGLFLVGSLSEGNMLKALIAAFIGIVVGMIGMDTETGQGRMTFGSTAMLGGIHFVVVMIGTFGISEALMQLQMKTEPVKQKITRITPEWGAVMENMFLTLRASTIGVIIGALPGTGGDIAALMAYDHAKRTVKNPYPKPFGEGAYQGLIAPEAAANAAIGGAFVPMMTLGIPGDSVTAVLIGALIIHGLRPGPMLMREQPEFFWFVVGSLRSRQHLPLHRGHDRDPRLQQDRRSAEAHHHPDHRGADLRGRLFDPEQHHRHLLDDRLRHPRLLHEALRLSGRPAGARRDPGPDHRQQLPSRRADGARERAGILRGHGDQPGAAGHSGPDVPHRRRVEPEGDGVDQGRVRPEAGLIGRWKRER